MGNIRLFFAKPRGMFFKRDNSTSSSFIESIVSIYLNVAKDVLNLKGRHDEKAFGDSIMYYLHMAARVHLKCTLG